MGRETWPSPAAEAYRDGVETRRSALRSAGEATRLKLDTNRTEISADPQRLAHIEISLVDEDDGVNPNQDTTITVEVDGPGVLRVFGSGAPATEESFLDAGTTSFNGRALAIARATGECLRITVTARAQGFPPASVGISTVQPTSDPV